MQVSAARAECVATSTLAPSIASIYGVLLLKIIMRFTGRQDAAHCLAFLLQNCPLGSARGSIGGKESARKPTRGEGAFPEEGEDKAGRGDTPVAGAEYSAAEAPRCDLGDFAERAGDFAETACNASSKVEAARSARALQSQAVIYDELLHCKSKYKN